MKEDRWQQRAPPPPLNLIQGTNAFIGQYPINFDRGDDDREGGGIGGLDGVDYLCWGYVSLAGTSSVYNDKRQSTSKDRALWSWSPLSR